LDLHDADGVAVLPLRIAKLGPLELAQDRVLGGREVDLPPRKWSGLAATKLLAGFISWVPARGSIS
jgi:hypothetical protein